jgi:8-oxo-dGTP pyrophosphatase MutT (NUDIX family)
MSDRWTPSVTVAALIENEGRFLLVEERTSDGLRLNNPAGHLEPGESPADGVIRETLEETGRVFIPSHIVGVYLSRFQRTTTRQDVTYVRFTFAGTVSAEQSGWLLDEGIVRALWMTADEIRASREHHRSPLLLRGLDDYLQGIKYPLSLIATDPSVFTPEIKPK